MSTPVSTTKNNGLAHVLVIIACLLWASVYIVIRQELTVFSPGALALFRYAIASIVAILFFFSSQSPTKITPQKFIKILLIGMLGIGLYVLCVNYTEVEVSAAVTSFLIGQIPIISSILALIFLKEKLSWFGWLGFFISTVGLIIIFYSQAGILNFQTGIIFGLAAAFFGAVFSILQKPILQTTNPLQLIAIAIWGGTLFLSIYTPQLIHDLKQAKLHDIFAVIYIGIFPAAIAYACWSYGLAKIGVTKASAYVYLMPLMTLFIAWFFIDELPNYIAIIGGCIAMLGSIVINRSKIK